MKKLLLVFAFAPAILFSQSRKERKALEAQQKADQVVISNLKNHIQHLVSGSASAQNNVPSSDAKAIDYIAGQFKLIGLQPTGSDGFIQPFKVDNGKKIDGATYLKVNDKQAEITTDYFPMSYSAEKKVKGKPAMALRERGVPWFVDLKDWSETGIKIEPGNVDDMIKKEIVRVAGKGATALFLYNSSATADGLTFNPNDKAVASSIPVLYITPAGMKKYFNDHSEVLDIDLNVAFKEDILNGSNVLGAINNAAATTVVVSAHYQPRETNGNGKIEAGSNMILRGADDNGSGIAGLIELAKMLSTSKAKNNNYLFIAFAGVDNGSAAENYWLSNNATSTAINYFVNLDMLGSYNNNKKLAVSGFTTSPAWSQVFTSIPDKKVELAIDSTGLQDEPAAIYNKKEIPGLSFSSTNHADYSNGGDDESRINYTGALQIIRFVAKVIETSDAKGRIAFSRKSESAVATQANQSPITKGGKTEDASLVSTKTTVSLGVIPDKANTETGLKIIGVTPKKIASKLGLQAGDILTNLGSYPISDLKSYMQALSNFKTGDKTILRIKRGTDDKQFAVEF